MFGPRVARRSLARYRKRGLDALERKMLGAIRPEQVPGARVLEIGGGIGAMQAELLTAGAGQGDVVELADAYEPFARELAREKGVDERSTFRVGDILENPDLVRPATIVVLNRVVCCSPDGVALAAVAAGLTERTLLLSFPRDRLLVRVGVRLVNGWQRMLGRSFRAFVHAPAALLAAVRAEGLRLAAHDRGRLWEFVALERP
jgi:hypothetical protein